MDELNNPSDSDGMLAILRWWENSTKLENDKF